jgi:ribonucleoside-diphosphate reductase alpha chain
MKFTRQFTKNNDDAYSGLEFKTTTSEIKNPDGTIVFSAPNIEVPC